MSYVIIAIRGNLIGFDIRETVRKSETLGELLRVTVEEKRGWSGMSEAGYEDR